MHKGNKVDELRNMLGGKNKPVVTTAKAEESSNREPVEHGVEAKFKEMDAMLKEAEGKMVEVESKFKQSKEDYLRVLADFDNFRKRSQKEKEELQKFAGENIFKELLPILDGFDQTLNHAKPQGELTNFIAGVELLRKQVLQIFAKFGVTKIECLGQPFDPNLHEAMSQEESPDHKTGAIIREWRSGYKMHEQLLRPAMVIVAK